MTVLTVNLSTLSTCRRYHMMRLSLDSRGGIVQSHRSPVGLLAKSTGADIAQGMKANAPAEI
jgi:hypothetical protein